MIVVVMLAMSPRITNARPLVRSIQHWLNLSRARFITYYILSSNIREGIPFNCLSTRVSGPLAAPDSRVFASQ